MIIAVDGPAASGKGTLARRLARHYGLPHLDTGLLYRATGAGVLAAGGDPSDAAAALAAAAAVDPARLSAAELRGDAIAEAASRVAAQPAVRGALLQRQRDFAHQPGGAVLDGRDIGTVIAPDAEAKLFVTASVEVRAERRLRELQGRGEPAIYDGVLSDLVARDARDRQRTEAPLVAAADAHVLDTSSLNADEAFDRALAFVVSALSRRGSGQPVA